MRGFRSAVADRISIHAAREGGDDAAAVSDKAMTHFNPRRP